MQTLQFFAAIGVFAWAGFIISAFVIGAQVEDASRSWRDKRRERHWVRTTFTRIVGTFLAACISFYGAGSASMAALAKQKQLDAAQKTATNALSAANSARLQVDKARETIKTLQGDAALLARESASALALATTDDRHAKVIAADVARLSTDTQRRLALTDRASRDAATYATGSRVIAEAAAKSARESQRSALSAAVQAGVYRLPGKAIAAISKAVSELPRTTSVYIACSPVLKELCAQLHGAFLAAGISPQVDANLSVWGGYDANPPVTLPNANVSYMTSFAIPARGISSALIGANLRTRVNALSPNTTAPNLEIIIYYVGATP